MGGEGGDVGARIVVPREAHDLTAGTCRCVASQDKKAFANVLK